MAKPAAPGASARIGMGPPTRATRAVGGDMPSAPGHARPGLAVPEPAAGGTALPACGRDRQPPNLPARIRTVMRRFRGGVLKPPVHSRLFGQIAEFISYHSMAESVRLAAERGPFPLYGESAYVDGRLPFAGRTEPYRDWEHRSAMPWDELLSEIQKHGIRNVLTTTIAPTGTISMIAGCSSGIEPLFSLTYTKEVSLGSFNYGCPALEAKHPDILDEVGAAGGVMPDGLIPDAAVFVTARQIHWADHILAQAAWQRWVGNSISKTINMAAGCTVRDVRDAYVLAHALGCRGITVYRDGSRDRQVLKSGDALGDPVPSDAAARCMA